MKEIHEQLKALVNSMDEDVTKASEGTKAAATRARKVCQEIKKKAQELRKALLIS